jgi:hypothetical protein
MNNRPRQILAEIIGTYGKAIADDPRRCEALLRDLCGDHRREIFVLTNAMREQVPSDLLHSRGVPQEVVLARLRSRLENNLSLNSDAARWAVESWALALGVISQADLNPPAASAPTLQAVQAYPNPGPSIGKVAPDVRAEPGRSAVPVREAASATRIAPPVIVEPALTVPAPSPVVPQSDAAVRAIGSSFATSLKSSLCVWISTIVLANILGEELLTYWILGGGVLVLVLGGRVGYSKLGGCGGAALGFCVSIVGAVLSLIVVFLIGSLLGL